MRHLINNTHLLSNQTSTSSISCIRDLVASPINDLSTSEGALVDIGHPQHQPTLITYDNHPWGHPVHHFLTMMRHFMYNTNNPQAPELKCSREGVLIPPYAIKSRPHVHLRKAAKTRQETFAEPSQQYLDHYEDRIACNLMLHII
jgi:hypothetical protein